MTQSSVTALRGTLHKQSELESMAVEGGAVLSCRQSHKQHLNEQRDCTGTAGTTCRTVPARSALRLAVHREVSDVMAAVIISSVSGRPALPPVCPSSRLRLSPE